MSLAAICPFAHLYEHAHRFPSSNGSAANPSSTACPLHRHQPDFSREIETLAVAITGLNQPPSGSQAARAEAELELTDQCSTVHFAPVTSSRENFHFQVNAHAGAPHRKTAVAFLIMVPL